MFHNRYGRIGWGGGGEGWDERVILVRHKFSIIPPAELNFEPTTLVSWVTPESIILYFSSTIR